MHVQPFKFSERELIFTLYFFLYLHFILCLLAKKKRKKLIYFQHFKTKIQCGYEKREYENHSPFRKSKTLTELTLTHLITSWFYYSSQTIGEVFLLFHITSEHKTQRPPNRGIIGKINQNCPNRFRCPTSFIIPRGGCNYIINEV